MAQDQARANALRNEAAQIEAKIAAQEAKQTSDSNCGCEVAAAVARSATTVALGAVIGLPISL